jgi:ribonuclease P protein subunit POP4
LPITKKNIRRHEIIGLEARIVRSSDPSLVGIQGTVIDETHNILVIDQRGKQKMIPKDISVFVIALPSGENIEVNGKSLVGAPEERIKKKR